MRKILATSLILVLVVVCVGIVFSDSINFDVKVKAENTSADTQAFLQFEHDLMDMNSDLSMDTSDDNADDDNEMKNSYSVSDDSEEGNDFSLKRLIVTGTIKNTYGAQKVASYDNLHILSYATEDETKIAYNKLSADNSLIVSVDRIVQAEEYAEKEYDYSGYDNWGAEAMDIGGYRQYLLDNKSAETDREVVVVVLDTGINTSHPMFEGRLLTDENGKIRGYSYHNSKYKYSYDNLAFDVDDPATTDINEGDSNKYSFEDDRGHGAHVAGIIVGLTPSNIKILPIKIANSDGNSNSSTMIAAYLRVINIYSKQYEVVSTNRSFGGGGKTDYSELNTFNEQCYNPLMGLGILSVTSAGNEREENNLEGLNAIAVSALIQSDNNYIFNDTFSNYGSMVDIAAPGTDILSAGIASSNGPCSDMAIKNGTSMASPHVAAAVALLRLNPEFKDYTAEQVEKKLYDLAVDFGDVGYDGYYGHGMVNLKYFESSETEALQLYVDGQLHNGIDKFFNIEGLVKVEAKCADPSFKIFYTTDGSLPTCYNGTEYTGSINVHQSSTMRFMGYKIVDGNIVERTELAECKFFNELLSINYDDYFDVDDVGWVINYTGNFTEIFIPEYIDGKRAKGLGKYLFKGNTELRRIEMPYVTTIGPSAFESCTNLEYVYAPVCSRIDSAGLRYCSSLSGEYYLSDKMRLISAEAFRGTNVTSFELHPDNVNFYTDGLGVYSANGLVAFATGNVGINYEIKEKVEIAGVEYTITTINASIANGAKINCLTIPETITTIGSFAFENTQINTLYYNSINCSASGYTEQVDSWTKKYNNVFRDAYIDTLVFGEKVEMYPEQMFWELDDVSNFVINSASMVMSRQGAWIAEKRSIHGITLNFTDEITKDYLGQLESSGLIPYGVNPFISKSVLPEDKTTTNGKFKNYNYSVQFGEYYYHSSASLDGQFAIYVTFDDGGFVSPHRGLKYFKSGTTQTYIIEPASGYQVESITVDGVVLSEEETAKAVENGYKFVKLSENHTLDVSFIKMSEFDIEIIPSEHGSIRRISGSYAMGDSATFEITPDAGYHIKHLIIDGEIVEASSEYTFENISANHTISAVFEANTDTKYIVKHWQQALSAEGAVAVDGKYYILVETDKLAGTTDTETTAVAKDYVGFTALAFNQTNIAGNGNAVIDIYYDRNEHSVFLNFGDELISATGDGTYLYGETVKIDAELQEDYKWIQWLSADESLVANSTEMDFIFTMPNGEVVFTAVAE